MKSLTLLNIGSIFQKIRKSSWNSHLVKHLFGIDIDFKIGRWSDIIKDDYKFPKTSDITVVRFYSPYSDDDLTRYIEKKYGQTHANPGKKYVKAFSYLVDVVEKKIKKQIGDVIYVNSPKAIKYLRNKVKMSKILIKNNIPHPPIIERPTAHKIIESLDGGKTLCIKPIAGSEGRGISRLVKTNKGYEVSTTWESTENFIPVKESHTEELTYKKFRKFLNKYIKFGCVVQEWIEPLKGEWQGKKWIFDIREVVLYPEIYNNAVTEMVRRGPPDEITTNISMHHLPAGYNFLRKNLEDYEIEKSRKLAFNAAKVFDNLNLSGVDIMWTNDGKKRYPVVIELNSFPGQATADYSGVYFPLLEMFGMLKSLGFIDINLEKLLYENTVEKLYKT
jgi:hypothetical protein